MTSVHRFRARIGTAVAVIGFLVHGAGVAVGQSLDPSRAPLPDHPHPWGSGYELSDLRFDEELDAFILSKMEQAHLPALSACVIHNDQIIWAEGYGLASIDPERQATVDTLYLIASNSKPVAATALLQLYDQGAFQLDDPINDYAPFAVHHPAYPDTPLSYRMLLSHTAGVRDWWDVLLPLIVEGDSTIPLAEFLQDYLIPGGAYYTGFSFTGEPGVDYLYTNVGFSLGAYMIEPLTGEPFADYCDANLFAQLDMLETSWFLAGLDPEHVAMPYYYDHDIEDYVPHGHTGGPIYPAGCLRTSVIQQARILMAQMNGGQSLDESVLSPVTVAKMQTPTATGYGLGVYRLQGPYGHLWIGHDGNWWGSRTYMYFRPADNIGIIMFTNGDAYFGGHDQEFGEIFARLAHEFSQQCPGDVDNNGSVDVLDLLDLLAAWGDCEGCAADVDHDGIVDVVDLLAILGSWGTCPIARATGPLGPIGVGSSQVYTLTSLPEAVGDVTFSFSAIADLGDASELINVYLNGVLLGTVFGDDGSDCPEQPDITELLVPHTTFNSAVPSGTAVLKLAPTAAVDANQCSDFSYIDVTVQYTPGIKR